MALVQARAGEAARPAGPRGLPRSRTAVGSRRARGLHGSPDDHRTRAAAVVLPLLLTAAYHSDTDLPAVLGEASRRLPGLRLQLRPPARAAPGAAAGPGPPSRRDRRARRPRPTPLWSSPPPGRAAAPRTPPWPAPPRPGRPARGWRDVVPAYASAASPSPAQAVDGLRRPARRGSPSRPTCWRPACSRTRYTSSRWPPGPTACRHVLGAVPEVADVIVERYLQAVVGRPSADPARTRSPLVS